MDDAPIREVERDPDEGIVVTIEDWVDSLEIPPPCAGCLGEATKRLGVPGVNWLEFPYCDRCVPPVRNRAARKYRAIVIVMLAIFLAVFVSLWFCVLALIIFLDVGRPHGNAVRMLLGESDTNRLAFRNDDYARLFVEANGAELPPPATPASGS